MAAEGKQAIGSYNKRNFDTMEQHGHHEPPTKRGREATGYEVRFLIPSKSAGIIIGKGGNNIKRLRDEYQSRVTVPDSGGPERVLCMESSEQQVSESILKDIFGSLIDEVTTQNTRDPASIGVTPNHEIDMRMLVHQSQAGCIIGKGGAKIKELRETAGLKVLKVYSMPCPNSTDRVIQMVGQPDDLTGAINHVLGLLEESPPRGTAIKYDARGFDDSAADSYGGWIGTGRGGMGGGMHGPPPGMGRGGYGMHAGPPMHGGGGMRGRGGPPIGRGGGPIGRLPGIGGGPPSHAPMGDVQTQQVSIPDSLTGSIMGRGGQRIKQIRIDSGADIRIDKGAPGEDRIITITGSADQIQNAQYLLQMCVKKYSGQY